VPAPGGCPGQGSATSPENTAAAPAAVAHHAAATHQVAERRRQAVTASQVSSGTTHTQWCVQENGDTSRPVKAQHKNPASRYPR
jgi:hypothetical protein